jgi:hypothetical protein
MDRQMTTFEVYGIVKSKGKRIAVGDNGLFSTDDERIINKLDQLGFKRIPKSVNEGVKPSESKVELPKRKGRPKKVKA